MLSFDEQFEQELPSPVDEQFRTAFTIFPYKSRTINCAVTGPAIAVQPLTALSRPQSGISLGSSLEATHHSGQDSGLSTDLIKPTLGEGSVADYSIGASAEATEQLRGRIKSLLASRDKLLAEVDAQSVEIERLGNENLALSMVRPCCANLLFPNFLL